MRSGWRTLKLPAFLLLTWGMAGCGAIGLGQGTANDAAPSGTIVAQGSFTGSYNGESVTGAVSVYRQANGDGTYNFVVRFESLSAPNVSGLEVVPTVNGGSNLSPSFYVLRAPTGNENYSFSGATCASNWVQVSIINPSATPASAQNYGIAGLTQVGTTGC